MKLKVRKLYANNKLVKTMVTHKITTMKWNEMKSAMI